jgi:hypothetical protein
LDRREEKERIQDEHKKRKVKERSGEGDAVGRVEEVGDDENYGGAVVTLGRSFPDEDNKSSGVGSKDEVEGLAEDDGHAHDDDDHTLGRVGHGLSHGVLL